MHYDQELKTKDLKTLFKPFASLQNRILIDYKKLRDFLVQKLKDKETETIHHQKRSEVSHHNKKNKPLQKILEDSRRYNE